MSEMLDNRIETAYRECARITRSSSSNFYIGFLALPHELRRAIYATYAFCRLCDDIVDEPAAGRDPTSELDRVQVALHNRSFTSYEDDPIFVAVEHAIERFRLNKQYFVDVIDGCRMDIGTNRYETFEDLSVYCRRVASSVGLICISIFGHQSPNALKYADDLGIAFQLTNILRDIREDYSNGRVYLPRNELREFGVSETEFALDTSSANFKRMMRFQVERARGYYERGERVMPLATRGRQCLELMSGFYSRILDKIGEEDADVLSNRVRLSTSEKLSMTLGVAWRGTLRKVGRNDPQDRI